MWRNVIRSGSRSFMGSVDEFLDELSVCHGWHGLPGGDRKVCIQAIQTEQPTFRTYQLNQVLDCLRKAGSYYLQILCLSTVACS